VEWNAAFSTDTILAPGHFPMAWDFAESQANSRAMPYSFEDFPNGDPIMVHSTTLRSNRSYCLCVIEKDSKFRAPIIPEPESGDDFQDQNLWLLAKNRGTKIQPPNEIVLCAEIQGD
jgi:hypothetical protein